MKKKLLSFLMLALILTFGCMSVFAKSNNDNYVVDDEDILTDSEEASLETELKALSDKYSMAFVVYTVSGVTEEYEARTLADDFFDYHEYGKDGMLLLLSYCGTPDMKGHNYAYISTTGKCIKILSNKQLNEMLDQIAPYVTKGEIGTAANNYVSGVKKLMNKRFSKFIISCVIIVLAAALIVLIVCAIMRSGLKSVHQKTEAGEYVLNNSMQITRRFDTFMTKTVTKTKIESSSGGGGSHVGSSGVSHGGGGRSC